MTVNEILKITPNMGMFDIAKVWNKTPQALKDKLPSVVVEAFTAFAIAIQAYQEAQVLYNTVTLLVNKLNQEALTQTTTAAAPPPSPFADATASQAAATAVLPAIESEVTSLTNSITNTVFNIEVPDTD